VVTDTAAISSGTRGHQGGKDEGEHGQRPERAQQDLVEDTGPLREAPCVVNGDRPVTWTCEPAGR
jgi:hypothetical protein